MKNRSTFAFRAQTRRWNQIGGTSWHDINRSIIWWVSMASDNERSAREIIHAARVVCLLKNYQQLRFERLQGVELARRESANMRLTNRCAPCRRKRRNLWIKNRWKDSQVHYSCRLSDKLTHLHTETEVLVADKMKTKNVSNRALTMQSLSSLSRCRTFLLIYFFWIFIAFFGRVLLEACEWNLLWLCHLNP